MPGVTTPWESAFEIEEMTDRDFDRRTEYLTWNVRNPSHWGVIATLADEWRVTHSKAIDRIIRYYLAHLRDTNEAYGDIEERYEVEATLPPTEHIEQRPDIDAEREKDQQGVSLPPAVMEMVEKVAADTPGDGGRSGVATDAVRWFVGETNEP